MGGCTYVGADSTWKSLCPPFNFAVKLNLLVKSLLGEKSEREKNKSLHLSMLAQAQFWCINSVTSSGCGTELNKLWPSGQILTFGKQSFMRTPSHLLIYMHLWFSYYSDRAELWQIPWPAMPKILILPDPLGKHWPFLLWNSDFQPEVDTDIPRELLKKFQSPRPNLIPTSPLKR